MEQAGKQKGPSFTREELRALFSLNTSTSCETAIIMQHSADADTWQVSALYQPSLTNQKSPRKKSLSAFHKTTPVHSYMFCFCIVIQVLLLISVPTLSLLFCEATLMNH